MGAQSNGQQSGRVYWDAQTGQPYTMGIDQSDPMNKLKILGNMISSGNKNPFGSPYTKQYIQNWNNQQNQSNVNPLDLQANIPTFADLFPQLASSQYVQPTQTTQTSSEPSYGAGRFLGTTK